MCNTSVIGYEKVSGAYLRCFGSWIVVQKNGDCVGLSSVGPNSLLYYFGRFVYSCVNFVESKYFIAAFILKNGDIGFCCVYYWWEKNRRKPVYGPHNLSPQGEEIQPPGRCGYGAGTFIYNCCITSLGVDVSAFWMVECSSIYFYFPIIGAKLVFQGCVQAASLRRHCDCLVWWIEGSIYLGLILNLLAIVEQEKEWGDK